MLGKNQRDFLLKLPSNFQRSWNNQQKGLLSQNRFLNRTQRLPQVLPNLTSKRKKTIQSLLKRGQEFNVINYFES